MENASHRPLHDDSLRRRLVCSLANSARSMRALPHRISFLFSGAQWKNSANIK